MKKIILLFYFLSPIILVAQNSADTKNNVQIHVRYEARYQSTSATFGEPIIEGFNRIYSVEDGLLISEGYYKKKISFSLQRIFTKLPFKRTFRMGLWTFYNEGKIYGSVTYDKNGNKIGEIYYYPNGNIKEARYRESGKTPWLIELVYSKDGELVDEEGDWNETYQKKKNTEPNTLYIALWVRWFSDLSCDFQARKIRKRIL